MTQITVELCPEARELIRNTWADAPEHYPMFVARSPKEQIALAQRCREGAVDAAINEPNTRRLHGEINQAAVLSGLQLLWVEADDQTRATFRTEIGAPR